MFDNAKLYLGSINHTLLSIQALQQRKVPIHGIIYNGEMNASSIDIITKMSGIENQYHIPEVEQIDTDFIKEQAATISDFLQF